MWILVEVLYLGDTVRRQNKGFVSGQITPNFLADSFRKVIFSGLQAATIATVKILRSAFKPLLGLESTPIDDHSSRLWDTS
jgi:hypothetical protein